jgi:hypothetical protein
MTDAEEDNNYSKSAAWNDDVEADSPGCIVRDGTADERT